MIQNQALLVNLSISQWTARKYDKQATAEVDRAHAAKDAGRYNKLLIDKEALKPIEKAANVLRDVHYRYTLSWGDNGDRLLPSKVYFDYTQAIGIAKMQFAQAVQTLVNQYPILVQSARNRLGTLYDPKDYPRDIANRFGVRVDVTPVPDAKDFRVDVGEEQVAEIRAQIEASVRARQVEAMEDVWQRVRAVIERYAERLRDPEAKVYESMVDNAKDLVALLPALNITNDPALTQIGDEIKQRLLGANTTTLKTNLKKRADIVAAADEMLARMPWTMTSS